MTTEITTKSAPLVRAEYDHALTNYLEAAEAWGAHLDALAAGGLSPHDGVRLRAHMTNCAALYARAAKAMKMVRTRERAAELEAQGVGA